MFQTISTFMIRGWLDRKAEAYFRRQRALFIVTKNNPLNLLLGFILCLMYIIFFIKSFMEYIDNECNSMYGYFYINLSQ